MGIDIEFNQIAKTYQKRSLYNRLTGTIAAGACTCVTGDNGSGKSTFLKIISALIRPSSGSIIYKDNNQPLSVDKVRDKIAFITPEMQFYDTLTATENLDFFVGINGISLSHEQICKTLEMVNLSQAASVQLCDFSTGMKQRLKLALLYASNKKVWLLDEPSSNLDQSGRQIVKQLIYNAKSEGRTILLATNEPSEVSYADTIYYLT